MLVNLENRFILTFKNSKLPRFCSLKFHRQAESADALSLSWKGRYVYAFPPHLILNRVLKKVEQEEVTMILIALTWTRREWYPLLLDLHIEVHLRLLEVRDLVSQQYHTRFHHNPAKLQLVAWMIRGISSLPQDFSCRLLRFLFTARSKETNQVYNSGCKHFAKWCEPKNIDPTGSTITMVLNYRQDCFNSRLA